MKTGYCDSIEDDTLHRLNIRPKKKVTTSKLLAPPVLVLRIPPRAPNHATSYRDLVSFYRMLKPRLLCNIVLEHH